MNIIQITAASSGGREGYAVFGLGDDQKLYQWNFTNHTWQAK
jgi:hypothetical protein